MEACQKQHMLSATLLNLRLTREALLEKDRIIAEKDDVIARKDNQVAKRDKIIAEKDKQLAEKDKLLQEKEEVIGEKDASATKKDGKLMEPYYDFSRPLACRKCLPQVHFERLLRLPEERRLWRLVQ